MTGLHRPSGVPTGGTVSVRLHLEFRLLLMALPGSEGAARREGAAGANLIEGRNDSRDLGQARPGRRGPVTLDLRHRAEQAGGVGVARLPEQRLDRRFLDRSEEHTSELQSLMRISYAVFCLKKKNNNVTENN